MRKIAFVFIICSFGWPLSFASEIHLKDEARKIKPRMLYTSDSKSPSQSALYEFKKAAIELDGKNCQKYYESTFKKYVKVQGWVALAYLNCLPDLELSQLNKRLKDWKGRDLWEPSPWQPALKEAVLRAAISHLKSKSVSSKSEMKKLLEWLGQQSDWLNREQLALVRMKRAEIAQAEKHFEEARFHLELAQELDPRLRETKATKSVEVGVVSYEKALRSEFAAQSFSKKWSTDLLGRVINFNPDLLIEQAQQLHRRGDYADVLFVLKPLFEGAALEQKNLPAHYLPSLWLGGRSAAFLGQYDVAGRYFDLLLKHFPGTSEASEALFRRALIFYRLQDWESARSSLQRSLAEAGEKYNLGSQYWLVRVLEKLNKKEEAATLAQELIQRYPWSYYGLRLQAELSGVNAQGRWVWKSPNFKAVDATSSDKLWLEGHEKASFERIKILVENGMQEEAHFEVKTFSYSFRPETHAQLSHLFQKMGLYLPAIMQLNSAQEKDPAYLNLESVRGTFPRPFYEHFQEESKKTGLPVELLLSLTRQESGFNSRALSTSQAMGLMQLIPPTAKEVAQKLKLNMKNPQEAFRPSWNIKMGSSYMSEVIGQFNGAVPLGLAGYNAGPHKVKRWLELRAETRNVVGLKSSDPDIEIWFDELPWSETSFYVKAILRNFAIYRILNSSDLNRGVDFGPVWWQ